MYPREKDFSTECQHYHSFSPFPFDCADVAISFALVQLFLIVLVSYTWLQVSGKITPASQISLMAISLVSFIHKMNRSRWFLDLNLPISIPQLSPHRVTLNTLSRIVGEARTCHRVMVFWREFSHFLIHACCSLWSWRSKWNISVCILDQWLFNLGYFCSGTMSSPFLLGKPFVTLWIKLSGFGLNYLHLHSMNLSLLKGEASKLILSNLCAHCTDHQVFILVMSWFGKSHLHWNMFISHLSALTHCSWDSILQKHQTLPCSKQSPHF